MSAYVVQVAVPSSKSLTQRALMVAALAPGRSRIEDPLRCDDSLALTGALAELGKPVEWTGDGSIEVHGGPRFTPPKHAVQLGNAGTAMRFLTPTVLLSEGSLRLDGVEAMRSRPMTGLLEALTQLGVHWKSHGRPGCPPLTLTPSPDGPKGATRPARVDLDPTISSQQLSALLMIGPALGSGLEIHLTAPLPSAPYVDLTFDVMERFGVTVERMDDAFYRAPSGPYRPSVYRVEGDHSSASYVWAASELTGRPVRITNLKSDSKQGDRVFRDVLAKIMASGDSDLDLSRVPDVAPTAAVCALFAPGRTRLRDIPHLRFKESDRLSVIANELQKVGARIQLHDDGWTIEPGPLNGPAALDPHGDHRMAMCFALVGLKVPDIRVADPECVSKSYPNFWSMLEAFR
jgi:3-phosphoshikimate 1-carboxyvinyltransferase